MSFTPVMQTTFNDEGNCLSACIASLYDVPIDDIPMFADNESQWVFAMSDWFKKRFGKYVTIIRLDDIRSRNLFQNSYMIACIDTINPKAKRHAVIVKGDHIIFDPMHGEILEEITSDMMIEYIIIGSIV